MTAMARVTADVILRCGRVHTFAGAAPAAAIAIRDGRVLATGHGRDSLDDLAGPGTQVVDDPGIVVLPGFCDTHVHQYEGGLELNYVPMGGVGGVDDIVERVRRRAQETSAGDWVVTARGWHESNLREGRLPNAGELDRASTAHPVCVRRGSHTMAVNTAALALASIDHADGDRAGQLIGDDAIRPVLERLPEPTDDERLAGLEKVGRLYNSRGIVAVRDPGIASDDLRIYQRARRRRSLTVRSRVMVHLDEGWPLERILAEIERWPVASGLGDDMLRLDGMKLFVDGRIDDAAVRDNMGSNGSGRGVLHLDADTLTTAVEAAVTNGWDVGCHAAGDLAVEAVLDAYERVLASVPDAQSRALVIEHAFFCDSAQRRRARELGVRISVHPPLLYAFAAEMLEHWDARVEEVMPIRELVEEGVRVAAGSDGNVPPFDPMLGIWTLLTRNTSIGAAVGRAHAVDRVTAFELYTAAGARLLDEADRRGSIAPGRYADLVAYRVDPLTCDVDDLPGLAPAWTLVGGDPVFDPTGCFAR